MSRVVMLDTGPLGIVTKRRGVPEAEAGVPAPDLIIATMNVGHLSQFVAADLWMNITF